MRCVARCFTLLSLLAFPPSGMAATAPATPTHQLSWGGNGNGAGGGLFTNPFGIASDPLGNVYVSDPNLGYIQKFDSRGHYLKQIGSFGFGDGEFNGPTAVAISPAGDFLYVLESSSHRIQKLTTEGVFVAKWGSYGFGNGQFNYAEGMCTDAGGNLYIADTSNDRIQKFNGDGVYLTQWGTSGSGDGQFNNVTDVAVDADGFIYVTDGGNDRVEKFDADGVFVSEWGTSGSGDSQFNFPANLSVDAMGRLSVLDAGNARVQVFDGDGTLLTQWGSYGDASGQFGFPRGLAVDAAGNVYVADTGNRRIQKFSGAGVAVSTPTPRYVLQAGSYGSGSGQFGNPLGIAADASGAVYVADASNNRIAKFAANGTFLMQWGTLGSGNGQFNWPTGVAVDAAGNVYVADAFNDRIQKFSSNGAYLTQWGSTGGGAGQFNFARDVAVDAAGNVFVADTGNNRVQKFTNAGAFLAQWGSLGVGNGQFDFPTGIATSPGGYVYVAEINNNRVQQFNGSGAFVRAWGGIGSGNGQFNGCYGLTTDSDGNVFVAEIYNQRVQMFTADGVFLAKWGSQGSGDAQFEFPRDVCADPAGNLWVVDQNNLRIQKFGLAPTIALTSDVANDQGRQVRLRVRRATTDAQGSGLPILRYDVYRKIEFAAAGPNTPAAAMRRPARGDAAAPAEIDLAGWEQVATFSARGDAEYSVVVPTLADATPSSIQYSGFFVSAVTADPYTYFDSDRDDGYSIDNLSPPAPTPFLAAYLAGATHLHWGVSGANDFSSFRLYRGSSADFTPGPGNFVVTTPDTGYTDTGAAGSYYKLSAVDWNGNESSFAVVGPGQTTDVPSGAAVFSFALEGARPSPATSGRLQVSFALPNADPATLELLDISGRRIQERAVGALGAGKHLVSLTDRAALAPGLYFVRLTQGANRGIVRVTVLN